MRKILFYLLLGTSLAMTPLLSKAQVPIDTVDAGEATIKGDVYIEKNNNTGKEFLRIGTIKDSIGLIHFKVWVNKRGTYNLRFDLKADGQHKKQILLVNGVAVFNTQLDIPSRNDRNFFIYDAGNIPLAKGNNTITIVKDWGYTKISRLLLYSVPKRDYTQTSPTLITPNASQKTKDLYARLRSTYGKSILSGSTDGWYDNNRALTGKAPVVVAFDFWKYTEGYTCKWYKNKCNFGAVDDKSTSNAIDLYNKSGGEQIISFQWHWYSPFGGQLGGNSYRTDGTTFDIARALINGTPEHAGIIRDIDAIAVQLKRLQSAGVPVLFRPLHEAGGKWFWWGAKGSGPAKQLWDTLYNRITNHHNIKNLIWVWSSPEPAWYPGNSKVDIIGYDSYPGPNEYRSQKNYFDQMHDMSHGKKLLALTENGPIPNISALYDEDAIWSFFMTWHGFLVTDNNPFHVQNAYNNPKVISLPSTPLPPLVAKTITYCQYDKPIALTAKGPNLKWYSASNGGNGSLTAPIPSTLTPGKTIYYVSQTRNGTEGLRWGIEVNVIAQSAKPKVTSPVTYFQNSHATALTASGIGLKWYITAVGGSGSAVAPIPNTATLGKTNYYVLDTNTGCYSPRVPIAVNVIRRSSSSTSIATSAREEATDAVNITEEASPAIFPNPSVTGDELTISNTKNVSKVTVTDVYGNSEIFDSPSFKTKLKGTLIIRILDDQGEKTLKAVVY